MKIEANSLQEAYSKAANELSCSVTELEINIIQRPKMGFMGLFKKTAIIEVFKEGEKPKKTFDKKKNHKKSESKKESVDNFESEQDLEPKKALVPIEQAIKEIKEGVASLMEKSCFDIKLIDVKEYDEDTVLIELDGDDAALLIGKEGYRYKAISYLLYSWISYKYGYCIRLEIAQFLRDLEEKMEKSLASLVEKISQTGKGQTKPLDGVMVKIALEHLRKKFPEKYVGIKSSRNGAKFVVVNDFNRK